MESAWHVWSPNMRTQASQAPSFLRKGLNPKKPERPYTSKHPHPGPSHHEPRLASPSCESANAWSQACAEDFETP